MRCAWMGGRRVSALGSCGTYGEYDGVYAPEVIANLSEKTLGYVVRKVRCENCRFGEDGCRAYKELNQRAPELFNCDPNIKPQACCNAQKPKG